MAEHQFIHNSAPYIAHSILALFGAFVHASSAYRAGDTKNLLDFLVLTVMSSFSGVMFALLGFQWFGTDSYLSLAMAGTGGFIGVEGMSWVVAYVKTKFK